MGTDLGNYYHHPLDGFRSFILNMMGCGITEEEIHLMTRENPAKILGI
jgi:predicted metal-dependent phosphotriesterase family hydrolase